MSVERDEAWRLTCLAQEMERVALDAWHGSIMMSRDDFVTLARVAHDQAAARIQQACEAMRESGDPAP